MSFSLRYIIVLALIPSGALLAGCSAGGLPAKATVTTIDRKCEIIESITREVDDPRAPGHKLKAHEMNSSTGACDSVEEWAEVRAKRTKKVAGTADIHVTYQAPQDGSYHDATLTFTGRDDEFYDLRAGDSVNIVVAKNDPARVRKV
ncbi:MAG: hypothetical protein ABIW03_01230 [Sphingomicrobium sp.]